MGARGSAFHVRGREQAKCPLVEHQIIHDKAPLRVDEKLIFDVVVHPPRRLRTASWSYCCAEILLRRDHRCAAVHVY